MKTEVWYVWREYRKERGDEEPRLLVPWSDPHHYEYAADGLFETPEEAEEWRKDIALDMDVDAKDWVLCRYTLEPLPVKETYDVNKP